MVRVSGPLVNVTTSASSVRDVQVHTKKVRAWGDGLMTPDPSQATLSNGVVEFEAAPGPVVMVLFMAEAGAETVSLVVGEGATQSLADAYRDGQMASDRDAGELAGILEQVRASVGASAEARAGAEAAAADAAGSAVSAGRDAARAEAAEAGAVTARTGAEAGQELSEDAAAVAVAAAVGVAEGLEGAKWNRNNLSVLDLNDVVAPGVYSQPRSNYATSERNYPESTRGTLEVKQWDASDPGRVHQIFTATFFNRIWMRERVNGTWSAWSNLMSNAVQVHGDLTYIDLNTVLSPGVYRQPLSARATAERNYPSGTRGVLMVYQWGDATQISQTYLMTFRGEIYTREHSPTGWEPWVKIGGGDTAPATSRGQTYRREAMKHASRLRRGGVIGTNGATPVALTFDHGYVNFRDKVLPHLRRLGLPCTSAFNQGQLGSGENEGIRWPELQTFGLNYGVEYAHHGYSHTDISDASTDVEGFTTSITQSIDLADANMPELVTEPFILPGVGGTNYDGFNGGWPWENWWEHPAGAVLMEHFPVISAKNRGVAVPMIAGEDMTMASDRLGWDTAAAADEFMAHVLSLEGTGLGVKTFMHPSQIDLAGKITETKLVEVLEFLAAERDAGRVEVLTMSGFAYADPSVARRVDLAPEPKWSGDTCMIALAPLLTWVAGAQVVLETTATAGGPLPMSATSDAGGLEARVSHQVQAGGKCRLAFTIPKSASTITLTAPGTHRACKIA